MYAQNNLQTAKKEFGLLAYDYYAKDQEEALRTHFESFKVQIDQIEEDIKSKQIALDYLDSEYNGMSPAGARQNSESSMSARWAAYAATPVPLSWWLTPRGTSTMRVLRPRSCPPAAAPPLLPSSPIAARMARA